VLKHVPIKKYLYKSMLLLVFLNILKNINKQIKLRKNPSPAIISLRYILFTISNSRHVRDEVLILFEKFFDPFDIQ
jgi:hypothetical protein